ncbi:Alpha-mannosidase 2x [Galemys pyrenaicus]|uniref:Alpha-mannosidase 2x n=1 Tax=Galemys pyrenaicus TaxID=202257 RepID=A0A8J6DPZ1_GALPY|nr:Alpha-mannosidase 2x [Galemys pyrenaicus]
MRFTRTRELEATLPGTQAQRRQEAESAWRHGEGREGVNGWEAQLRRQRLGPGERAGPERPRCLRSDPVSCQQRTPRPELARLRDRRREQCWDGRLAPARCWRRYTAGQRPAPQDRGRGRRGLGALFAQTTAPSSSTSGRGRGQGSPSAEASATGPSTPGLAPALQAVPWLLGTGQQKGAGEMLVRPTCWQPARQNPVPALQVRCGKDLSQPYSTVCGRASKPTVLHSSGHQRRSAGQVPFSSPAPPSLAWTRLPVLEIPPQAPEESRRLSGAPRRGDRTARPGGSAPTVRLARSAASPAQQARQPSGRHGALGGKAARRPPLVPARMKLKKQVTVCGAAIFCVAVFSLYLMLDRVQHDPSRHQSGGNFPRSQISVLQNRIEQLEQLLEENHQIISHIKDSVLELTANAEGPPALLPYYTGNGSWVVPPEPRPSFFSVSPQDCQFALGGQGQKPELQMLTVTEELPFDNVDGGVWKQGFDIAYGPHDWDAEDLQVFVVPHSHNDPGWIKTFDKYYAEQTQHILNGMAAKLQEDPRRRFLWAEVSFFAKWWENISNQKRAAVRRPVPGEVAASVGLRARAPH